MKKRENEAEFIARKKSRFRQVSSVNAPCHCQRHPYTTASPASWFQHMQDFHLKPKLHKSGKDKKVYQSGRTGPNPKDSRGRRGKKR